MCQKALGQKKEWGDPYTPGDQVRQLDAVAHLSCHLESVSLRPQAVQQLTRTRLHQLSRSDSDVLYQQVEAGGFAAARTAMNIGEGAR